MDNELKELEVFFFNFIWHNKRDKIARKTVIQNYENGGLKMVHLESFIKNLKVSWLQRLLHSNSGWVTLFYHTHQFDPDFLVLGRNYFIEKANSKNKFWNETLLAMSDFISCVKVEIGNIFQEPIWYNDNIRINNKCIFLQEMV